MAALIERGRGLGSGGTNEDRLLEGVRVLVSLQKSAERGASVP